MLVGKVGLRYQASMPAPSRNVVAVAFGAADSFVCEKMGENNPKYAAATAREKVTEAKKFDIRNPFQKDYDRIIYSPCYERLRLKSQSFPAFDMSLILGEKFDGFSIDDMVSSRMSHVEQVSTVAQRVCQRLGLNQDLALAIGKGHDVGHSPFGHEGERALKQICQDNGLEPFWHEKNGLRVVDDLVTINDFHGNPKKMNLTYAVRDGIISHCGEVDQNALKPRELPIDLKSIKTAGQIQPYTWEGCVVKVADKVAYLGRDIEDAARVGLIKEDQMVQLKQIVQKYIPDFDGKVGASFLINLFENDLVEQSDPERGIGFSENVFNLMKDIKTWNYENIYRSPKQKPSAEFTKIITTLFDKYANGQPDPNNKYDKVFINWLENTNIYNLEEKKEYKQAVVDFISGMTDLYATANYKNILDGKIEN